MGEREGSILLKGEPHLSWGLHQRAACTLGLPSFLPHLGTPHLTELLVFEADTGTETGSLLVTIKAASSQGGERKGVTPFKAKLGRTS